MSLYVSISIFLSQCEPNQNSEKKRQETLTLVVSKFNNLMRWGNQKNQQNPRLKLIWTGVERKPSINARTYWERESLHKCTCIFTKNGADCRCTRALCPHNAAQQRQTTQTWHPPSNHMTLYKNYMILAITTYMTAKLPFSDHISDDKWLLSSLSPYFSGFHFMA